MIYLWETPESFLEKNTGEYDRDCSPDRFLLRKGRKLHADEFQPKATVIFEVPKYKILKFDCLPNNSRIPLINERVKIILEAVASDDIQFFPAKLACADGELEGYYFLNVIDTIKGIDYEKSICIKMQSDDAIIGFNYLTLKNGCMGNHNLAREKDSLGNLLVSDKIKSIFDKEKVTGVWLVRPEDYYRPLSELL